MAQSAVGRYSDMTMLRPSHAVIVLILLAAIGVGWYWLDGGRTADAPVEDTSNEQLPPPGKKVATSPALGLQLLYPSRYLLTEHGPDERGAHTLVLMEDTAEHRAIIDGTAPPREGPPTITIERHPNPDALPVEEWLTALGSSTLGIAPDGLISDVEVAGREAKFYRTSGLYEGYALITTAPAATSGSEAIYVVAVTYLAKDDQIVDDFNDILDSLEFLP